MSGEPTPADRLADVLIRVFEMPKQVDPEGEPTSMAEAVQDLAWKISDLPQEIHGHAQAINNLAEAINKLADAIDRGGRL